MFHKIAILVAALAVIFPGELRCEQNGEPGVITGTVTYLQRMALPPDAVVDVQLRDVSLQDVPAKVIAESTIATAEKQVPIAFRIPFAIADINSAHIYAVGATITFGGNVMFSSTASYPVITRGAPTQIEIVVRPILAEEAPAHEAAHGLQVLKPVTFAGDLPCADCAGMRFTLTLRPDGIFLSRTNYRGKGKPFHDLIKQVGLFELADCIVDVEFLDHVAHVGRKAIDIRPQVRGKLLGLAEERLEVVLRRVVERLPRGLTKCRMLIGHFGGIQVFLHP